MKVISSAKNKREWVKIRAKDTNFENCREDFIDSAIWFKEKKNQISPGNQTLNTSFIENYAKEEIENQNV